MKVPLCSKCQEPVFNKAIYFQNCSHCYHDHCSTENVCAICRVASRCIVINVPEPAEFSHGNEEFVESTAMASMYNRYLQNINNISTKIEELRIKYPFLNDFCQNMELEKQIKNLEESIEQSHLICEQAKKELEDMMEHYLDSELTAQKLKDQCTQIQKPLLPLKIIKSLTDSSKIHYDEIQASIISLEEAKQLRRRYLKTLKDFESEQKKNVKEAEEILAKYQKIYADLTKLSQEKPEITEKDRLKAKIKAGLEL